jgi:hypothetical protein
MIMPDYTLVSVFNRKSSIQVRSNSAGQLLFIHKDKNTGLRLNREGRGYETLIVLEIVDIVENLVSCIDSIGSV